MIGEGRESKKDNDLFYTCSLIDYIARKTKNTRVDVVNTLGKKNLDKIYELADVYHCDNIDNVSGEFVEKCNIQEGKLIMSENVNMQSRHIGISGKYIKD